MAKRFVLLALFSIVAIYGISAAPTTESLLNDSTVTTVSSDVSKTKHDEDKASLHRVSLTSSSNLIQDPQPILSAIEQISNIFGQPEQSSEKNSSCTEDCSEKYGMDVVKDKDAKKLQSCIAGCRYYTLNLILIQRNVSLGYPSPSLIKSSESSDDDVETNKAAKTECNKSCQQSYQNETKLISICNIGCEFAVSKNNPKPDEKSSSTAVKTVNSLGDNEKSDLSTRAFEDVVEEELGQGDKADTRKNLFSIILPSRSIYTSFGPVRSANDDDFNFNGPSNSLMNMMANIGRSLSDYTRMRIGDLSNFIRQQQQSFENGNNIFSMNKNGEFDDSHSSTKVREGRFSFDPSTGESVSVQRSMSVMMSKDKDGHNRMVVMRQPPKITIHHGWNPFGLDLNNFMKEKDNSFFKPPEFTSEPEPALNIFKPSIIIKTKTHNIGDLKSSPGFDGQNDMSIDRIFGIGPVKTIGIVNNGDDADEPYNTFHLLHRFSSLGGGMKNMANNDDPMIADATDSSQSTWVSASPLFFLFILILSFILFLYIIIWMFYYLPKIIVSKAKRMRQQQHAPNVSPPSPPTGDESSPRMAPLFDQMNRLKNMVYARGYGKFPLFGKDGKEEGLLSETEVPEPTKNMLFGLDKEKSAASTLKSPNDQTMQNSIDKSQFPSPPPSYSSLVVIDDEQANANTVNTKDSLPRYSQLDIIKNEHVEAKK